MKDFYVGCVEIEKQRLLFHYVNPGHNGSSDFFLLSLHLDGTYICPKEAKYLFQSEFGCCCKERKVQEEGISIGKASK